MGGVEAMSLWTRETKHYKLQDVDEDENELMDNVIMDSCVPQQHPNNGLHGDSWHV